MLKTPNILFQPVNGMQSEGSMVEIHNISQFFSMTVVTAQGLDSFLSSQSKKSNDPLQPR